MRGGTSRFSRKAVSIVAAMLLPTGLLAVPFYTVDAPGFVSGYHWDWHAFEYDPASGWSNWIMTGNNGEISAMYVTVSAADGSVGESVLIDVTVEMSTVEEPRPGGWQSPFNPSEIGNFGGCDSMAIDWLALFTMAGPGGSSWTVGLDHTYPGETTRHTATVSVLTGHEYMLGGSSSTSHVLLSMEGASVLDETQRAGAEFGARARFNVVDVSLHAIPDGGATLGLLGSAAIALAALRRRLIA